MAPFQSLSSFILAVLALVVIFVNPAISAPRKSLERQTVQTGFGVTLKHVDSGKNLTKFERLQRGIKRGQHRLQSLNAMAMAASSDSQVEASVHAGTGEFLMSLAIGTPPETFSAIVDSGSDLIWTQCKPCKQCYDQPTPIFDPKKSSSFSNMPCNSQLCDALPSSTCDSRADNCQYFYQYGDYSTTEGAMATETFTFGDSDDNKVAIHKIGFGCGTDNEGDGFSQGAGLVGLGRGPLSLVSQLKEPKFSYCLTSIDNSKTSTLLLGSLSSVKSRQEAIITPLIRNPSQPSFYFLSLEGISVGGSRLSVHTEIADDGSGGLIIDCGTTISYIYDSVFDSIKKEFISQTKLGVDNSGASGLDLCFALPSNATAVEIPNLVFHFKGGDLDLPAENYMVADKGLLCLVMGSSGSTGMSIFGNIQQQNFLVIHDLAKETVSFIPTQCDQLRLT